MIGVARYGAALAVTLTAICALAVWSAGQAVAALLFGLTAAVIPALGVAASYWHRQLALRRRIRAEVTR